MNSAFTESSEFAPVPSRYEFYNRCPENILLVEALDDEVIIHAARDNFSELRKSYFIRELAEEGFIPDVYQWFTNSDSTGFLGVKWVIDDSWLIIPPEVTQVSTRMFILIFGGAGVLWLLSMVCLFLSLP